MIGLPTPGEASAAADAMLVTGFDPLVGDISVSYTPSCAASDHTIYYGDLADVSDVSFSGQVCGLGTTGSTTFDPGPGSVFWLVVANDGAIEGSYGTGDGGERPEDTALTTCYYPQDLTDRCD